MSIQKITVPRLPEEKNQLSKEPQKAKLPAASSSEKLSTAFINSKDKTFEAGFFEP